MSYANASATPFNTRPLPKAITSGSMVLAQMSESVFKGALYQAYANNRLDVHVRRRRFVMRTK